MAAGRIFRASENGAEGFWRGEGTISGVLGGKFFVGWEMMAVGRVALSGGGARKLVVGLDTERI